MRFVITLLNTILCSLLMSACHDDEPFFPVDEDGTKGQDLTYLNANKLQEKHNQEPSDDDLLRVLAIGNSYTENALLIYLHSILAAEKKRVEIGILTKSSSTLEEQLELGMEDGRKFTFYYIKENGERIKEEEYTMEEALCYAQWDYVSVQQYSKLSGKPESIYPYLPYLLTYIRNNVPYTAKILWHQTWAYEANYTNANFSVYDYDQEYMYSCICSTSDLLLSTYNFYSIVPSGTAVQNARSSELSSSLSEDGTHLCKPAGCYVASCVWAEFLMGIPCREFSYHPSEMSPKEAKIAQECADAAIKEWNNRTSCE